MTHPIKKFISLVALLALAAGGDAPEESPGFRDTSKPLSVTTRANNPALHGQWFVREQFPGTNQFQEVFFATRSVNLSSDIIETRERVCRTKFDCSGRETSWTAERLGINRWRLINDDESRSLQLWMIWIDQGFRTAAVGTPDGSYGWIIDRSQKGGADRINAAREVLQFNGYQTRQLVENE